jgi:hypothetical protein
MDEQGRSIMASAEFESDAQVAKSVVGLVKARDVHLTESQAGFVLAGGNFSILNGGCGPVMANGSLTIRNGGCGPVMANGDVSIENGGAGALIANGGARIGPNGTVALVVSPRVTMEEGSRILLSSPVTLAIGAAAGVFGSILVRLLRPRR